MSPRYMHKFRTLYSEYELDIDNSRIRRVSGVHDPSPGQGPDGEWKTFTKITPIAKIKKDPDAYVRYLIDWDGDGADCTLTSPIQGLDD